METARIFIVDDEVQMAKAMATALARDGYACHTFHSAETALKAFTTRGAELVLTDQRMPGMEGTAFMRRLLQMAPRLPVIIVTAFGGVTGAVQAMKEGAFDYVTKPFDNTELRTLVARALQLKRLKQENQHLREALGSEYALNMVAESPAMKSVLHLIQRAAGSKATVLIQGESGTGKEVVARLLHFHSARVGKPFVAVNCKAFAEGVLESELFGHEKGAFTGAYSARAGCFERAHGGSLFLDEIGEVGPSFQAKILRTLQEGEVLRVGGSRPRKVDVRVIAASNQPLRALISQGKFREDLFFRINVIPMHLPPLRNRAADILPLAHHFLQNESRKCGRWLQLDPRAAQLLQAYAWPGNVRELENAVERAAVLAEGGHIQPEDFLLDPPGREGRPLSQDEPATLQAVLDAATQSAILKALAASGGRRAEAAQTLGIERTTLYRLMKRLDIEAAN